MAILMIDDDVELCELMQRFLAGEGFELACAHDGEAGLEQVRANDFELLILDIMMPVKNGMDVLRELRGFSQVPVIMLTARGEEMDRIIGLELGADDYLPKPCNPRELAARIRAILRRSEMPEQQKPNAEKSFGSITWQPQSRTISEREQPLDLTATEYNILAALMEKAGEVVDKQALSKAALGKHYGPFDRTLDVHIGHLRKKLSPLGNDEPRIKTVRGVGWLFVPE
ncbi:two component transcriptional regulator, winged helix family [Mariprofundus ferrinatatus]|uniref:Two component transcriptional regulator, winged helix family n=1 Tax=Mariprofundus ferrinatatus TaxID=1921087 RepID=A0A2K8L5D2_9PROT|nr:response regulator transcription factor [Mariprofundus ferrinatatus]ATX82487.1 two component transcriptional regulator, winged helix family [Mariprofundus ferrinatatus]